MYRIVLLIALLAPAAAAQEIRIVGPDKIEAGEYHRYDVVGISEDQLARAELTYEPQKNVIILPAKTWGGEPFLFFMAKDDGKYTVEIKLNVWRKTLKQAIQEAVEGNVDEALVLDLRLIDEEAADTYPTKSGGLTITVGEPGPNPKPPPPGPNPTGPWSIVFFWETGSQDLSLSQLEILASMQFHEELRKAGHLVRSFDPSGASNFPEKYKGFWDAVKDKPLPQVSIAPIEGGDVWSFALPESKDTFLKRLEAGPIEDRGDN